MNKVIEYIDERLAKYNQLLGRLYILVMQAKTVSDRQSIKAAKLIAESAVQDLIDIKEMMLNENSRN